MSILYVVEQENGMDGTKSIQRDGMCTIEIKKWEKEGEWDSESCFVHSNWIHPANSLKAVEFMHALRPAVCVGELLLVGLCNLDAITVVIIGVTSSSSTTSIIIHSILTLLVGWDSKAIIFSRLVAFDYRNLIKF